MDIKSYNKGLAQQCKKAFNMAFIQGMAQGDVQNFVCSDTDSVRYLVQATNQKVTFYFSCIDAEVVWNYCYDHLIKTYFKDIFIKLTEHEHKKVVQIIIDNQILEKIRLGFNQKQESGILTGKKKFDAIFENLSKKLASIKRHFFASPFQMMLNASKNNTDNKTSIQMQNLCYFTKPDRKQKVWLAFQKTQFSVYYGISFQDRFQQQLAKIYFSQLMDAKKHVQNAPNVMVSESHISEFLIGSFPQQKNQKYAFTNGIVSITLYGKLIRNPQYMATYLANFRNYAYYHIQASKCYLHSRVLRRINHFNRDLQLSKIENTEQK